MRAVDRDEIHSRQHLVQRIPIGRLERFLDLRRHAAAIVIVDRHAEGARAARQRLADAAHADNAETLAGDAPPSIQVGDQPPLHRPSGMTREPSTRRRAVDRISAIVMSAVSSVRTPGVLVTVMPRLSALVTSMWSTPLPKLAMSFICSPA